MKFNSEQPKILVVGSSSIDLVLNTEKYPQANETVMAVRSETFFGGKGANQAVGTSRLGANTMRLVRHKFHNEGKHNLLV